MEEFAIPKFKTSHEGFTLLEVMIAGTILVVFILLSSRVIQQGAHQVKNRRELVAIANRVDAWTAEVRQSGFFSETLNPGWHQKEVVIPRGPVYSLQWQVVELNPLWKGIVFQLRHPTDETILYEWKSARLHR